MKSALLQYPYVDVFGPLEKICKKKGYSKIKIDQETGILHASKGIQLFNNHVDQITRINITASSFKISHGPKDLQEIEERFVETIYKFF